MLNPERRTPSSIMLRNLGAFLAVEAEAKGRRIEEFRQEYQETYKQLRDASERCIDVACSIQENKWTLGELQVIAKALNRAADEYEERTYGKRISTN